MQTNPSLKSVSLPPPAPHRLHQHFMLHRESYQHNQGPISLLSFPFLLSLIEQKTKTLKAYTAKFRNSFFPTAIRLLNSPSISKGVIPIFHLPLVDLAIFLSNCNAIMLYYYILHPSNFLFTLLVIPVCSLILLMYHII